MNKLFGDETDFSDTKKACNWCHNFKKLMSDKPFCLQCYSLAYRECCRCHRPYSHQIYFKENEKRCNACHRKYILEREKII